LILYDRFLLIVNFVFLILLILFVFRISDTYGFKRKNLIFETKSFNNWNLNHWGGHSASLLNGSIKFIGVDVPKDKGEDGIHFNLQDKLTLGKKYEVNCHTYSDSGTNAKIRLWCHDNTDRNVPNGSRATTEFKTPRKQGEEISLTFKADYNRDMRIHIQYKPGNGAIYVDEVKIYELI
jgi:hypothetical protein